MCKSYPFNIFDVVQLCGIKKIGRPRGGTQDCVCPFCGSDSRSFAVTAYRGSETKNLYNCFRTSCMASGNMIQLYMRLNGIAENDDGYAEAERILYRDCAGMVREEPEKDESIQIRDCAEDDRLNAVYRCMYSHLTLNDRHKADLLRRGLSEKHFTNFRSVPTDKEERRRICRLIMREGYSLEAIPGFYKNQWGDWDMNVWGKHEGYFCPEISERGQMVGFQIRLDHVTDKGAKYLAFSSSGRNLGASPGSRNTYFVKPGAKVVYITEGILKAYVIRALGGVSVVGVPGIGQKRCVEEAVALLKQRGVRKIVEIYDMDKFLPTTCMRVYKDDTCLACSLGFTNYGMYACPHLKKKRAGLQRCSRYLQATAKKYGLVYEEAVWNVTKGVWNGRGKGFDDFIFETPLLAKAVIHKTSKEEKNA